MFAAAYPSDYPEPESLVLLHRQGLEVVEVPVRMHPRQAGLSSIRMGKAWYYMLKVTLSMIMGMFKRVD